MIGQLELMWGRSANHRSIQLRRRQSVYISTHIAQTTNVVEGSFSANYLPRQAVGKLCSPNISSMSGGARPIASLNPSWLIENYAEPMLVTHLFTHTGGPLCSCWILGRPNATMMVWSDTKPGFAPPGFGPFRTNFLLFAQFCITETEKTSN